MGRFETEADLILHPTLCESLRYSKLIGIMEGEESLKRYSDELLKKFIKEQLVFFPNSKCVIDQWIVTAADLFDAIIIRDEIPIADMPPAHQTALEECKDDEVKKICQNLTENMVNAALREMGPCKELYCLPSINELIVATRKNPVLWDPIVNFRKSSIQCQKSYDEQMFAIKNIVSAIDQYEDCIRQCTFIKCRVICGSPGCGKSFILNYTLLYAISKGLKVATDIMTLRNFFSYYEGILTRVCSWKIFINNIVIWNIWIL